MPLNREWQSRIKAVEREYLAMQQAASRFRQTAIDDPTILKENLRCGEIVAAAENLEATYFIRLFAEFETGARQYWSANWKSFPRTFDLLNGLAARREIPETQLEQAQLAREYRNSLVHEREGIPEAVLLSDARHYLCHFFSFLPYQW